jgi:hypothetical protein
MYQKSATVLLILSLGLTLRAGAIGSGGSGGGSQPSAGPTDPIVGVADSENCIPFSCDAGYGITTYQQVYSSAAFSGVTPFNQISFFLNPSFTGDLDSGTYDIYFSYTSQAVNGLSSADPSDNIGADETLFGDYTLSGGVAPSTLTFSGSTFDYDPTMGNLLMTIDISGAVDGSLAFYDSDETATVTSRAYFGATQGADGVGLVTGFASSSIPEPSTFALLGTGIALLGFRRPRNRRRQTR